jgi:hypothetical protein
LLPLLLLLLCHTYMSVESQDVAQLADAIAGNLTALCRQLEQLCGQALSLPPAAPARIALMVELAGVRAASGTY